MGDLVTRLINNEITSLEQYWEELGEEWKKKSSPVKFSKAFLESKTPTQVKKANPKKEEVLPEDYISNDLNFNKIAYKISKLDKNSYLEIPLYLNNFEANKWMKPHARRKPFFWHPSFSEDQAESQIFTVEDIKNSEKISLDKIFQKAFSEMWKPYPKGIGWISKSYSQKQVCSLTNLIKGTIAYHLLKSDLGYGISTLTDEIIESAVIGIPSLTENKKHDVLVARLSEKQLKNFFLSQPKKYDKKNLRMLDYIFPDHNMFGLEGETSPKLNYWDALNVIAFKYISHFNIGDDEPGFVDLDLIRYFHILNERVIIKKLKSEDGLVKPKYCKPDERTIEIFLQAYIICKNKGIPLDEPRKSKKYSGIDKRKLFPV